MKKLSAFLLVLVISFLPVAGKTFCDCSANKKNTVSRDVVSCDEPQKELASQKAESLLTHFLYTL